MDRLKLVSWSNFSRPAGVVGYWFMSSPKKTLCRLSDLTKINEFKVLDNNSEINLNQPNCLVYWLFYVMVNDISVICNIWRHIDVQVAWTLRKRWAYSWAPKINPIANSIKWTLKYWKERNFKTEEFLRCHCGINSENITLEHYLTGIGPMFKHPIYKVRIHTDKS